jgi:hypothetical protein
MIFTMANGVSSILNFIIYAYPVKYDDGSTTLLMPSGRLNLTEYWLYLNLSLQTWILGIKYLESAMICS